MKLLIVFDLDGPLLDGKDRHYACYSGILQEAGYNPVPLDEYWQAKRALVPASDVLRRSGASDYYSEFKRIWLAQIEAEEMLALDHLQNGAAKLLRKIAFAGNRIVIVTLRQHSDHALNQTKRLGILNFIDELLIAPHTEAAAGKAECVLAHARRESLKPLIWVGDTEMDAEAAATLGVPCALVANGVRSRESLHGLPSVGVFSSASEIPFTYFLRP